MATREQLIEDFADHKLATGEKFVRLINSTKAVQEPVADPTASGTSLSFIDSISQDADGKITATKKTLDLANAHELNPFKGWYKTGDTLPTDGFDGAYLYFKDTSELTGQTTIYRWNGTAYADTGTVVDTSNVNTFATGQAVNETSITDRPSSNSDELITSGAVFDELYEYHGEAVDPSSLPLNPNHLIISATGKWVVAAAPDTDTVSYALIAGSQGNYIKIKRGSSAAGIAYTFLKTSNPEAGVLADFATGYSSDITNTVDEELTLLVPNDANYLYFIPIFTGVSYMPAEIRYIWEKYKRASKVDSVPGDEVRLAMPKFILGMYIQSVPASSSMNYAKEQGCDTSVNYCAVTNSVCMLPYRGVTLHIKVPDGMVALIKFLTNPTVYDVYSQVFEGESTYKVNEKYIAFIIDLYYPGTNKKTADETRSIDIDEVNGMIESGEFSITYEREELNVNEYLRTVVKPWDGTVTSRGRGNGTGNSYKKYATFLHVSDLHGDATRWRNALDAATELGVDAVINTGDSCQLSVVNGMGYIDSIGEDYAVPQLITVGNHDACKTGTPDSTTHITLIGTTAALTNQELYEEAVEPYYVKNGYQLPSDTDYNTAPTYWYKDFTEKKIRYISVNEYEEGRVAPNSKTIFYGSRISQKQIDWLCNTLLSTPAGYGVLIAVHSTPCPIVKPSVKGITGKDEFCQTLLLEYTATTNLPFPGIAVPADYKIFGMMPDNPNPLVTLIDKFIEKQAAHFTYTNAISTGTETVTVDADFSAVNSGVEFIAWVAGHGHFDYCSYIEDSEELQLLLMVTTSNALYPYYNITALAEDCDLYRGEGRGEIQDAYNVYCIDRDRKEVRIGKGGSNLTVELKERKMLVLPYAETNN